MNFNCILKLKASQRCLIFAQTTDVITRPHHNILHENNTNPQIPIYKKIYST